MGLCPVRLSEFLLAVQAPEKRKTVMITGSNVTQPCDGLGGVSRIKACDTNYVKEVYSDLQNSVFGLRDRSWWRTLFTFAVYSSDQVFS